MPGIVGTGNTAVSNVLSTPVELRKSDRLERLWGTRKRDEDQRGEFLRGDDFSRKTDLPTEGLGGAEAPILGRVQGRRNDSRQTCARSALPGRPGRTIFGTRKSMCAPGKAEAGRCGVCTCCQSPSEGAGGPPMSFKQAAKCSES